MSKSKLSCATIATVLIFLLILPTLLALPKFGNVAAASDSTANGTSAKYGNLLQYEWPQFQGDPSFTRFSAGPAPEAPDILWKTNITGIQSYLSAFNGMVFVTNSTTVFALDRANGSIIWNTTVPASERWPAIYKIDDTHMVIGSS